MLESCVCFPENAQHILMKHELFLHYFFPVSWLRLFICYHFPSIHPVYFRLRLLSIRPKNFRLFRLLRILFELFWSNFVCWNGGIKKSIDKLEVEDLNKSLFIFKNPAFSVFYNVRFLQTFVSIVSTIVKI